MQSGRKQYRKIKQSHLFDAFYYLKEYGDVRQADIDPIKHFIKCGWKEGRNPSKLFDTSFYLENNQDVVEEGINPLYHFINKGFAEGRKAVPDYEPYKYWCLFNSQCHGLKKTIQRFRDIAIIQKSELFDKNFYLLHNPDIEKKITASALWKWRESTNPLVRAIAKLKTSAVAHFVFHGVYERRDPVDFFSLAFYINNNPDLLNYQDINPFVHYIVHGQAEGRLTNDETQSVPLLSFWEYSNRLIQEKKKDNLSKTVTVIMEVGKDIQETSSRLEMILSQTHQQIELICIDQLNNAQLLHILEEKRKTSNCKFEILTASLRKKQDCSMWQDALRRASSDFVWLVPENNLCQSNFLNELLQFFSDESVIAAFCPTRNPEEGDSKQKNLPSQLEYWTNSAIKFFNRFSSIEEMQFHRAAFIFRNIFSSNQTEKEIPLLTDDHQFRLFLFDLLHGEAIAFSSATAHWFGKSTTVSEPNADYKKTLKEHRTILESLHSDYQIPQFKIRNIYEKDRSALLKTNPDLMDEFTNNYDLQKIVQKKVKINIMISIVDFSLGGGEIMPIRLANQLKQNGCSILIHSMQNTASDANVRALLDPSIPVVTSQRFDEMAMILKEFKIDVINTHHQANQSFIATILHRYSNFHSYIAHVGTSHGMYENFSNPKLQLIFDRMRGGVDHWTYVADKNLVPFKQCRIYEENKFTKISNGMKIPELNPVDIKSIGIPENSFRCCIASRALPEKGWREAITAITLARQKCGKDIQLLLIGDGEVYQQLLEEKVPNFVHVLGFCHNPCDYYAISDVCLIPSFYRSESAPLSLIESLLCHKPVISSDIGDIAQMLSVDGELAGDIFSLHNWTVPIEELADLIIAYATDKDLYQKKQELVIRKAQEFDIVNITNQYYEIYQKCVNEKSKYKESDNELTNTLADNIAVHWDTIKVSIIVPNYNHEKFLRRRLDSIYNQTYTNFEVLLLDDCSTDNSREILQEYANRYPENTRVMFNDKNSGGVYHQWAKGIFNSTSEYCWIAESDDFCELNFLEKVMPAFKDSQVKLSYCQYSFVNPENVENSEAFFNYVGTIDKEKWRHSYVNDSSSEVETALGIKNTIPNASGMVFRKPQDSALLEDNDWLSMRICGDWIFYLHILQNGKIAYTTETKSYFRFHSMNTSVATYSTGSYYKEHEKVAYTIRQLYDVSDAVIKKNYENIHHFFIRNVHNHDLIFEKLFDLDKVLSIRKNGK